MYKRNVIKRDICPACGFVSYSTPGWRSNGVDYSTCKCSSKVVVDARMKKERVRAKKEFLDTLNSKYWR